MPHAEIAGAGFAGLTAAAALGGHGWSVRVHERARTLRPGGFGLGVYPNGARVLRALGAFEEATAGACRIERRQTRDAWDRTTSQVQFKRPMFRCSRRQIIAALAHAATRNGVEIVTGSAPVAATADGTLVMADGRELGADLVLLADGVDSKLRASLGIVASMRLLREGALRLIIPRLPGELDGPEAGLGLENWSGTRRIIRSPLNAEEMYMALSCLAGDETGRRVPLDLPSWKRAFPGLHPLLDRIAGETDWDRVQWAHFQVTTLESWSRGRTAVLGDAAHAMPPNLGQGALCAMMSGFGLAAALAEAADVASGLRLWEARERPLIEHTQRMSMIYGRVTVWPSPARSLAFWLFANVGWLRERFMRTANHIPTGTAELAS